jgi:integrase
VTPGRDSVVLDLLTLENGDRWVDAATGVQRDGAEAVLGEPPVYHWWGRARLVEDVRSCGDRAGGSSSCSAGDRDAAAPLFPAVTADRLRTAIARACKAAGVPVFSPHDLRHRRISLLHKQGRTWAEIGRLVGQRKLSITADTYTHVLIDGREVAFEELLAV